MKTKILPKSELMPRVAVVVGTRPGIVKFAPVIKELERRQADYFLIHTGQHYSPNMDRTFFDSLELPQPRYTNPDVANCKYHGEQTAHMIMGVERALLEQRPSVVIVGGDANTNLAGALATRKLANIKLAHMEAGLRSRDWSMPEEHNRVMIDHISEVLFPPTETCRRNLLEDGVHGRIVVTGNTIVDAVRQNYGLAEQKSTLLERLELRDERYGVLTIHREENVDNERVLRDLLRNLDVVADRIGAPLVFPIHPRTRSRLDLFGLHDEISAMDVRVIDPVDYLDMLSLLGHASLVLTDSGGIQEEACVLQVPCITLRENTERPETVEVGANKVVGTDPDALSSAIAYFERLPDFTWDNPYGDGHAAERIVAELLVEIST